MNSKKVLSLALTGLVGLSSLAFTSFAPNKVLAAQPKGDVKVLTNVTGGKDADEMTKFSATVSKATGLNVTFEKPSEDFAKVLMQKLQSGEKYDLIYLNHNDMINLQSQDALVDITNKVKNSKIMQNNINPQEWKDIEVNGKIYAGLNKTEVFIPVNVNVVHLKQAGIDYKKIEPTLEGYYQVFKKLKETIKIPQYYPLNTILSENWDLQPWMAAVGLKGGVVKDKDGKTYVPYATDAAAPVWEWLAKLYKEGLLDPSSAVDKTKDMRAKMGIASQQTSVNVDWLAWAGLQNATAAAANEKLSTYEVAVLPGCKTPSGDYMIRKGNASLWGIPANAKNVDGAFAILEFFATQEGGNLLSVGIEGVDYKMENGKMVLTEVGAQHSKDHGAPFPAFKDYVSPLGYNQGVAEGLELLKYASIENPITNEAEYKEIVGNWGVKIVKGDVKVLDGLSSMRKDLVSRGISQK